MAIPTCLPAHLVTPEYNAPRASQSIESGAFRAACQALPGLVERALLVVGIADSDCTGRSGDASGLAGALHRARHPGIMGRGPTQMESPAQLIYLAAFLGLWLVLVWRDAQRAQQLASLYHRTREPLVAVSLGGTALSGVGMTL